MLERIRPVEFELFSQEDTTLEKDDELIKQDIIGNKIAADQVKVLTNAYRKLLKTTKKLMQGSDKSEEKVNR